MIHTVAHYLDATIVGGCEEVAYTLLAGLDRDRWNPVLLHHDEPSLEPLIERAHRVGIATHALPRRADCRPWHCAALIASWARQVRPAVFHAHLSWPLACRHAILAARFARTPVVLATSHLYVPLAGIRYAGLKRRMQTAALDRYIAVSHEVARCLNDELGVPPRKLSVVRNGIAVSSSDQALDPQFRSTIGDGEPRRIIFTPARLHRQKGHQYLLEAARDVPDALFLLAGEGPNRDELQKLAMDLGISDRVRFLGHRPDVARLLMHCDVFVLPSLYEGLPLSVLEAMAAGRPVVATDVGGTNEAVVDGVSGLLVPPADSKALAAAINVVLADPARAADLAAAGRARVHEFFSAEAMVRGVQDIYQELLGGPGAAMPSAATTYVTH